MKLNKYQPVEEFDLLDATGLRANRSFAEKKKDDDINPINSAKVSLLYSLPYFFTSLLKGRGRFFYFDTFSN
jgi:hypothetical protein